MEETIKQRDPEHLGDGVYASCDGWNIVLDLRGQDNTTLICLEPDVFGALMKYAQACGVVSE